MVIEKIILKFSISLFQKNVHYKMVFTIFSMLIPSASAV